MASKSTTSVQPSPLPADSVLLAQPQPAAPPPVITVSAAIGGHGKKVTLLASVQALIVGLRTYYQPGDVFQLKSGPMTRDELVADLEQYIQAAQTTATAYQEWRADVQGERALVTHIREERGQVRGVIEAKFGKDGTQLLTFGFPPRKARKPKAKTAAIAVAKREATREARGTRGSVQKQDIHGNVTAELVVTPAAAPVAAPVVAPVATQNGSSAAAK